MMMRKVTGAQARQLLHNKFVVVLGASVQRGMYKDLVHLLQSEDYLELRQLKAKGELCFEGDTLVEGGRLGAMNNGTQYREVRQFRTDHHLVRFYFLTRIYSPYMLSILEDFRRGPPPDVIFVNSCLWDISRYGGNRLEEYKENLQKFFTAVKDAVSEDCLMVWLLSMPLGDKIRGGFLIPEVQHLGPTLRFDVIEANFDAAKLAAANGLDVLDLHYNFRLSLQHRMDDSTHWNQVAHRCVSWLLLRHMAEAWGVDLWGDSGPPASLGQWTPDLQMCDNWATGNDDGGGGEGLCSGPPASLGQWTPDLQMCDNWATGNDDGGGGEGLCSDGGIQLLREDFGAPGAYLTPQQNLHNPGNKGSTSSKGKKRKAKAAQRPGGQAENSSSTAAVVSQLDFTSDPVLPIDGDWHNPDWHSWHAAIEAKGYSLPTGYSENSVPLWQIGVRGRYVSVPQNAGALSSEVTLTSRYHVRKRRHDAQPPARVHPYHPQHRPSSHRHNPYSW